MPGKHRTRTRTRGKVPAAAEGEGPFIRGPPAARVVAARRRLGAEGATEQLLEGLTEALQEEPGATLVDVDVAQNASLTAQNFEALFDTVTTFDAPVVKWRLFGCLGFNDEAAEHLAAHLAVATAETAPAELHLSDCAITTAGFLALMRAVEEGGVYPKAVGPEATQPLFLRCERNFIDEAAIEEKVSAGIMRTTDTNGSKKDPDPAVMVHMFTVAGRFAQKQGDPPDAGDGPPPKSSGGQPDDDAPGSPGDEPIEQEGPIEQEDTAEQEEDLAPEEEGVVGEGDLVPKKKRARRGGRRNKAQQTETSAPPAEPWRQAPRAPEAARPSAAAHRRVAAAAPARQGAGAFERFERKQEATSGYYGRPSFPAQSSRPTFPAQGPAQRFNAFPSRGLARAGAAPPPRSRTPPPAARRQRPRGGRGGRGGLPGAWQEHMSDQYGVPYYYNPETRETTWHRPA